MSFSVLIVPEDPSNNGYILKPLVERMLSECGKARAVVDVLKNPRPRGYANAKSLLEDGNFLRRYHHKNLLLFLPDADGKNRDDEFRILEERALGSGVRLLCCAAQQEVEVWLLAGHVKKLSATWTEIRRNASIKEQVFEGFLAEYGDHRAVGKGRKELMEQTLKSYRGLLSRCPELAQLEGRIRTLVASP